ncbi:methyltransferase domain protein [Ceratobasidium sp. AG-Ba]|nr:methyltransferase domain protein [Ceratobasidium sp. AG-Ba]
MGVFSYLDSDTGATLYHVIPSPESEAPPSEFYSETDSTVSASTIQSDDLPGYFVLRHGRQQPASDNIAKWFPSDNIRRHMIHYFIMKSLFGGHYSGPVKEALSPINDRQRQLLELGTRTGTWVQAMATEFPHVQFLSLDVVPMVPHIPRSNITFEVYDLTEGLMVESGSQDVVFLSRMMEMVINYRALLREAYRVLRPGGLLYVEDYKLQMYRSEDMTMVQHHTNPQGRRAIGLVQRQLTTMGIDIDTCEKLPQWLGPSSDVWDKGQKGFKGIESIIQPVPLYPHDGFPCATRVEAEILPYLRHLTRINTGELFSVLKDTGMEDKEIDMLIRDMNTELSQHEGCAVVKVYRIYGIKE